VCDCVFSLSICLIWASLQRGLPIEGMRVSILVRKCWCVRAHWRQQPYARVSDELCNSSTCSGYYTHLRYTQRHARVSELEHWSWNFCVSLCARVCACVLVCMCARVCTSVAPEALCWLIEPPDFDCYLTTFLISRACAAAAADFLLDWISNWVF
jgi:hypothetical protein